MPLREDRAPVWAIWLLIAFGAAQPLAWWLGVGLPRHPVVLVPLLVVWITLLAIAAIEIFVGTKTRTMRNDHFHAMVQRTSQ